MPNFDDILKNQELFKRLCSSEERAAIISRMEQVYSIDHNQPTKITEESSNADQVLENEGSKELTEEVTDGSGYMLSNFQDHIDLKNNSVNSLRQPQNFLLPTNKVIRNVFDGKTDIFGNEKVNIDINPNKARGQYIVSIQAYMVDSGENIIKMPRNLNSYDENVLRGIFTLLDNGYTIFTAKQVYNAFAGKSTNSTLAIEKVVKSIDKMRATLISIDWSAHARMRGIIDDPNACIVVNENFISADHYSFYLHGQKVAGYKINKIPPLYRYAKESKQLSNIDRSLLEAPLVTKTNAIKNTDMNIIIKNEILLRIDTMKKNKSFSRLISFSTLYKMAQVGELYSQKSRTREAIVFMLDAWKNIGHIKDYRIIKNGAEYSSIEIILD